MRFGLSFLVSACARLTPEHAAATADRHYATQGFAWLAAHDPSALVAWGISPAELRPIARDSRILPAREADQCAQAAAAHAALFVLIPEGRAGSGRRNEALDCGVALYRDRRVIVIAPR